MKKILILAFLFSVNTLFAGDAVKPGDQCSPYISNNAAAAGVCKPVCSKLGLKFAGNWTNVPTWPSVKACSSKGKGKSVCGCAAVPGDKCSRMIPNNRTAVRICKRVCKEYGLVFAGNWTNKRNWPSVKACRMSRKGKSVCGCKNP